MVTIVKHEWHSHDRQYAIELDQQLLSEIYPDMDEDEIDELLQQIENGERDFEEVLDDAHDNDVEIEWEFQYDDCFSDRKGGYEITYELGDDSSWVEPEKEPEPTHKCTKCRWNGQSYNTLTQYLRADGTVIEDYHNSEEESDDTKDVCPMCDSDVELTEVGVKEEKERQERMAQWDKEEQEADEEAELEKLKVELDNLNATSDERAAWPFVDVDDENVGTPPSDQEMSAQLAALEDTEDSLGTYPAGEYTIRIWGRTREIGVNKISKAQYEYWSDEDHEYDLGDALNDSYDYDENETPKKARFDRPYYDYQDKISFWGFDQDDTHMTIENSNGETVYEGDLESFVKQAHGDRDSYYDAIEELEELYPGYLGKGYWLMWTQGGKGSCIQTTIVTVDQEFDPKKLKVFNWDVEGSSIVTKLAYDGVELEDEGMDSDHDNWRGQWSQFDVYHNK